MAVLLLFMGGKVGIRECFPLSTLDFLSQYFSPVLNTHIYLTDTLRDWTKGRYFETF